MHNYDIELIKKYLDKDKWDEAIKKLENNYPVQYIIGNVNFYGYELLVDENVLIPRFETEYLVEKTIKYLNKLNLNNIDALDIGTGSGCISIALKKEINSNIDAIDISSKALEVAKKNALINQVSINFYECDIHKFNSNKKYDLIISNPPYVPFNSSNDEKIKYEPESAIYADNFGLYYYDIILSKITNNLKDNYLIAFEIGDKEGIDIINLVKKYLPNSYTSLEYDYNNFERYIFISNKKEIFE